MTNQGSHSNSDCSEYITIVSGLPRSGTSMMMKMLEAGGMELLVDNIRVPDQDNPKGYYEYEDVKTLPDGNTGWLTNARGKAVKVIAALIPHLPEIYTYHVIFMHRDLSEILASQLKMLSNRGKDPDLINIELMTSIYEKHLKEVDRWVDRQLNVRRIDIVHRDLIFDPIPQIMRINEFLGSSLDVESMKKAIDPGLYRQRKPD